MSNKYLKDLIVVDELVNNSLEIEVFNGGDFQLIKFSVVVSSGICEIESLTSEGSITL